MQMKLASPYLRSFMCVNLRPFMVEKAADSRRSELVAKCQWLSPWRTLHR